MSIFGEYRHGSMSKEEFEAAARWEFRGDNDIDVKQSCEDCVHYVQKAMAEKDGKTVLFYECEFVGTRQEGECDFEGFD